MVRLGELQTMPCDILNCGVLCGAIMVALLFTVPCALLDGLETVVLAKTLLGHSNNKITAQTWFLRWWWWLYLWCDLLWLLCLDREKLLIRLD